MSRQYRSRSAEPEGTRFLLYPQPPFLEGFDEPEVVSVSSIAGSVGPGPSDDRMYTVYPLDKLVTYGTRVGPRGAAVYATRASGDPQAVV